MTMQVSGLRKTNEVRWRQTSASTANGIWRLSLVSKIKPPRIKLLGTYKYVLLYYLNKQALKVFSNTGISNV